MSKILFLHGMFGQNSSKPIYIQSLGHQVLNPILDDWNFENSVVVAQELFNKAKPDIIVGSSRGGAVAMNIDSQETPLILLAPAWPFFGKKRSTKKNSTIIHSKNDQLIYLNFSIELSEISGCKLVVVGKDHRLNCDEARNALKLAIKAHTYV